jgi:hypothetical protein
MQDYSILIYFTFFCALFFLNFIFMLESILHRLGTRFSARCSMIVRTQASMPLSKRRLWAKLFIALKPPTVGFASSFVGRIVHM